MIGVLGWIVLGLPLLGAVILMAFGSKEPSKRVTQIVGCGSIGLAFVATVIAFFNLLGEHAEERTHVSRLWEWIDIGQGVKVDFAIRIDQLSIMMMLVITGVGFLIHWYSTEYMAQEGGYRRFFAEMNFFVFSMLLLVEAANFVFLIIGWAFVGLASYLLIGFYYDRPVAVAAAKKAFVINVLGDIGMVVACFLLVRELGTLDYDQVFATAPQFIPAGGGVALSIALLLFVGAMAKSAQAPLHTWLPDAMEGPTPVSALIHAATMVTAGVYLVVRTHVLFELSPLAMNIVAGIGAFTLLMAATIAIAQVDIKRVLAWSTVSQIGYMIMATGLGAFASGMFHFLTHAFFKALLFLTAGIIIHALHGEQSLDKMGGLRKPLRFAYFAFATGCLAIAGVPGFAGFFSKDEIIGMAAAQGTYGWVLFGISTVGAFLTSFYMFRLLLRVFYGSEPEGGYHGEFHMSGPAMTIPVAILTVLSIVGGWIQVPFGWKKVTDWLEPVVGGIPQKVNEDGTLTAVGHLAAEPSHKVEVIVLIVSLAVALLGILLAWYIFAGGSERRMRISARHPHIRSFLEDAWRFDEVYDETVVLAGRSAGDGLRDHVEPNVIVGAGRGTRHLFGDMARFMHQIQTGLVRTYAVALMGGLAGIALIFILVSR
jgi:NADH-quinone oxidoreductase subunit L